MASLGKTLAALCMAGAPLALPSCDGIYDSLDDMPTGVDEGNSFSYIDATEYTTWTYVSLADHSTITLEYDDTVNIPDGWAFALHRYDCKTNGGGALETGFTSLEDLEASLGAGSYSVPEASAFVPDVDGEIAIDMSRMMSGDIGYADSGINVELGKWLDLDTSVMPPIYTPSGRVYLLRMNDGTVAALLFTGFSNPFYYDAKGYISLDYIYPLE